MGGSSGMLLIFALSALTKRSPHHFAPAAVGPLVHCTRHENPRIAYAGLCAPGSATDWGDALPLDANYITIRSGHVPSKAHDAVESRPTQQRAPMQPRRVFKLLDDFEHFYELDGVLAAKSFIK